jgi:hypothetical protein
MLSILWSKKLKNPGMYKVGGGWHRQLAAGVRRIREHEKKEKESKKR